MLQCELQCVLRCELLRFIIMAEGVTPAMHCNTHCCTLQHTATHCIALQTYCNTLQTHCNTLQHAASHFCQAIVVEDKLWGLFACHHHGRGGHDPLFVPFQTRNACEFLVQAICARIRALLQLQRSVAAGTYIYKYVCVYVYIYIYVYVYVYICIHMYIHVYIDVYIHVYMYMYM